MTPLGASAVARAPLTLLLALRYLKSTRRDSFATFLSAVAVGGLALGVAALILALSALSGFQNALRGEVLARTPEIEIDVGDGATARSVQKLAADTAGVDSAAVVLEGLGWLAASGSVQPLSLLGFEGELPPTFPQASRRDEGLYLPAELASSWALEPGDVVEIASAQPTLTPLGPQPRVRRLALHGVYRAGKTEHEYRAALPLGVAESLLVGGYRVRVATGDLARSLEVANHLSPQLPAGASLKTWQQLNRALFFALRLEKSLMFVGILLIVMVAALALVSDLSLVISNRRREIGMLRALGAQATVLQRAFLTLGVCLGGAGVLLGAAAGIAGAIFLDRFRLLQLPNAVYFLDYVPFLVRPGDVAIVVFAAVFVALAATTYATRSVLAMRPVEALRR